MHREETPEVLRKPGRGCWDRRPRRQDVGCEWLDPQGTPGSVRTGRQPSQQTCLVGPRATLSGLHGERHYVVGVTARWGACAVHWSLPCETLSSPSFTQRKLKL